MPALSPALFCALLTVVPAMASVGDYASDRPAAAEVRVCLAIEANVNFGVVMGAQRTAAQIFEGIGVHIHWVCGHIGNQTGREIVMRLADNTSSGLLKGALAFALPYTQQGVRITIFYDRVERMHGGRDQTGIILGHTLAHELAHILKTDNSHSGAGIMRPRWDDRDIYAMQERSLAFSQDDVRAIYRNLAAFTLP